ncbi:MAG TPA: sigma 54-interacting transcriptional regulator [Pirellulaceae bacterium]|nr:sigma 54-interacting transcriptional regulator [Pirellulaceae bacterium]
MNQAVLVLSRNPSVVTEVARQLEGVHSVVACESIEALRQRAPGLPIAAVLVHLDQLTLEHHSPGRFIADLDDAINSAPLFGLLDEDCPPKLRKLAERAIDECLELPQELPRLRGMLSTQHDLSVDLDSFWEGMPHKELHGRTRSLVTFTTDMFDMLDELKVAARHNVTVLLVGETGSGKTHLARLIHEMTDRREERFCTVACGALPPDLIESELFGSTKGAFTGADKDREGKFAAAGKGTLLLDEIDVLTPEQQAKLLRVIETGEYEQVGSNETRHSEARLIVASNYNLEELVQQGTFRTDLFYRLNILSFRLPPLRERPLDVEYLARKFALEHSRTHNIVLREIEPSFLEALRRYPWPGNIREMENVIRRAVLYCQRGVLSVKDLPSSIRAATGHAPRPINTYMQHNGYQTNGNGYPGIQPGAPVLAPHIGPNGHGYAPQNNGYMNGHNNLQSNNGYANGYANGYQNGSANYSPNYATETLPYNASQASVGTAPPAVATAPAAAPVRTSNTLETRVDVIEQRIIEDTLRRNNHRRKETAAELGISRVTLYNKMKKFGML